jgi:hypothetical protein
MAAPPVAMLAAILVGVLVMANPLNGPEPVSRPVVSSQISHPRDVSEFSTSTVTSPTPPDGQPGFSCGGSGLLNPNQSEAAIVDSVRTERLAGYDRLTIWIRNGIPASVETGTLDNATFSEGNGVRSTTLAGRFGFLVEIGGVDTHAAYRGTTHSFVKGYNVMVEVRRLKDSEGAMRLAIGLSKQVCYESVVVTNPVRLVVDMWPALVTN